MTKSLQSAAYRQAVAVLIDARKSTGLTQQQVADRLGKPQSYVAKVERCERRLDVVEFIALAKALNLEPLDLFKQLLLVTSPRN